MELVGILNIFTNDQFEQVWEALKGHQGSLEIICQYMHAGMPLDQTMDNVRSFTFDIMLAGLRDSTQSQGETEKELLEHHTRYFRRIFNNKNKILTNVLF